MHNNVITNHAEAKVLMFIQIIYIHVNIYVHFYISTKCFIMYYHILSKQKIYFKHMVLENTNKMVAITRVTLEL